MFLLQKNAITKVPSVLERTRKSALFMWKWPFSQIPYHALFDSWGKHYSIYAMNISAFNLLDNDYNIPTIKYFYKIIYQKGKRLFANYVGI